MFKRQNCCFDIWILNVFHVVNQGFQHIIFESILRRDVFNCTANFGSSLHPPQTASTADSSSNRTALPQISLEAT